jgi:hypothetical protein
MREMFVEPQARLAATQDAGRGRLANLDWFDTKVAAV